MDSKKIIVTGGAGFIGSNLIRHLLNNTPHQVINVDKLTYAGNLSSLADVASNARYQFEQIDIVDVAAVSRLFEQSPDAVMHLAAESHVDRSIDGPEQFVQTNIVGTFNLLQSATCYYNSLEGKSKNRIRFHHVTTDEVYGSLGPNDQPFTEISRYEPNSPYAATKASSDHLVRAWSTTYGLPVLVSSSSNNYGPNQFPEKLIPLVILKAINGEPIPVYGDGSNIRDWIYVGDHVEALATILEKGEPGQTYNVGGNDERTNLELVQTICRILDDVYPVHENQSLNHSQFQNISDYEQLITLVPDRPGHDFRYANDSKKIREELGWLPKEHGNSGMEKTVHWYLENRDWWESILSRKNCLERKGLPT